MSYSHFTLLAFTLAAFFTGTQASALSEDDKTMNTPSAGTRFSDPDDAQAPGAAVYMQNGHAAAGGVDSSSVRYDYDPASGSYVPMPSNNK